MVTDVTDFEREVIEKSREQPVLVDFWAPWCGPCRTLGPILERLAGENQDAWTLAKLNTDENQDVAQRYRIQSIPAVKLFVDGEVADEFLGALPERQVRDWLDKAVPNETRRRLQQAQALLRDGDAAAAEADVRAVLADEPDNADALVVLAGLIVLREPQQAAQALERARGDSAELTPLRDAVRTVLRALELQQQPDRLPDDAAKTPYISALDDLARGDIEAALAGFVDVVRRNRRYDEDGARRACLALFELQGAKHPLTAKYRRALEMALF